MPRRPARVYVRAALLTLLALLLVYVLYTGWSVYRHAAALREQLGALRAAGLDHPKEIGPRLHAVREHVALLRGDLAVALAIAPRLGWLPSVGPTLAAAPELVAAGESLLDAGLTVWDVLETPLVSLLSGELPAQEAIASLCQRIEAQGAEFERASARAREGLAAIESLDATRLLPRLGEPLARVQPVLPLVAAGFDGLALLPELLGPDGERTYLLLAQNNEELRATGGFISSIGVLSLSRGLPGSVTFQDSYTIENWDKPHPDPPEPLRKHMGLDLWVTRDANWWPDYPTSARAVAALYTLNQERPVHGVVALDMTAAVRLVETLVPLALPDGTRLEAGEVEDAFRRSWSLSPGSLVTPGVVVTATQPFSSVEVALMYNQRGGRVWFDSVEVRDLADPEVNLVANPSFEDDADGDGLPDGWTAIGLAEEDRLVSSQAHTGERSLLIVGDETAVKSVRQHIQRAGEVGAIWRISAMSRSDDTPTQGGNYALVIRFHGQDGSSQTEVAGFPPLSHDWASAGTDVVLGEWWQRRKDFMNATVSAAMARLLADPMGAPWLDVLGTLKDLLDERHIQVYFQDAEAQALVQEHGWAGALADARGDYLLVVDSNVGYNKLNATVEQAIEYAVELSGSGPAVAQLTVRYRNPSAPTGSDEEETVCDKHRQYSPSYEALTQGCYWNYVRVYAPLGAELLSASGGDEPFAVGEELGRAVLSTAITLRPGEERVLDLAYRLPASAWQGERYELLIQKQAGTTAILLTVRVTDTSGSEAFAGARFEGLAPTEAGPSAVLYRTDLRTDRRLSIVLAR